MALQEASRAVTQDHQAFRFRSLAGAEALSVIPSGISATWTYPSFLLSTRQEGVGTLKARQKHGSHHGSSDGTLIGDS